MDVSDGITIIHTPGHTRGHICLLYSPREKVNAVLFTGDHIALFETDPSALTGHFDFNWFDVKLQRGSIRAL